MDELLASSAQRIFTDLRDQPQALWQALESNGLHRAWAEIATDIGPDSVAASGAANVAAEDCVSLADGLGLARIFGAAAVAVPFTETLLASWLAARLGWQLPPGAGVVVQTECGCLEFSHGLCTGRLSNVLYAAQVQWVCAFLASVDEQREATTQLVLLPVPKSAIDEQAESNTSLSGEPLAGLQFEAVKPLHNATLDPGLLDELMLMTALLRTAQLCGAMDAALDLSLHYASEREQFGRSLAKFQAVQHMLSEMAGESCAASAAVDAAVAKAQLQGRAEFTSVAVAKCRASEAAGVVAAHAHQVHGAMGYTAEYPLARLTRRLWQWRDDCGDEHYWAMALGHVMTAASAPALKAQLFGKIS